MQVGAAVIHDRTQWVNYSIESVPHHEHPSISTGPMVNPPPTRNIRDFFTTTVPRPDPFSQIRPVPIRVLHAEPSAAPVIDDVYVHRNTEPQVPEEALQVQTAAMILLGMSG